VVVNPPTNPWRPGAKWEFPTYTVPRKQDFIVTVNNRRNDASVKTSLLATTGQFTIGTQGATVPRRGVAALGLVPELGVVVYGASGNQRRLGALVFVDEGPASAVQVLGKTQPGSNGLVLGRFDEKDKRVVLFTPTKKPTAARSAAIFQDASGLTLNAQLSANIPGNGKLVVDYARWNANRPTGIKAYVVSKGKRTSVRVTVS